MPPVVSIGKLEPPHCYFVATHTGAPAPHVNGTAQQGYQVAIVNPGCAVNPIDTPTRHAAAARSATGNNVVAGFDGVFGMDFDLVCQGLAVRIAQGKKGSRVEGQVSIPGPLYRTTTSGTASEDAQRVSGKAQERRQLTQSEITV